MNSFIDAVSNALSLTAWEMDIPRSYGLFHICLMLVGFSLCFFIGYKLRNLNERQNRRLILGLGIFLSVCEIYKQAMVELVTQVGDGYNWRNLSFQLCSIPMYLFLIIPFLREGRLRRALCTFIMTYNLLGGFIAFFEPSGLFHEYVTLTVHALIWHFILVMSGAYLFFSGRGGVTNAEYFDATKVFLVLCAMAFSINCIFFEMSKHKINMFFLGPGEPTIIVFQQIYEWLGWGVSMALYIPSVCLGAYLLILLYRYIDRKSHVRPQLMMA